MIVRCSALLRFMGKRTLREFCETLALVSTCQVGVQSLSLHDNMDTRTLSSYLNRKNRYDYPAEQNRVSQCRRAPRLHSDAIGPAWLRSTLGVIPRTPSN